jgi:hypothetical protein
VAAAHLYPVSEMFAIEKSLVQLSMVEKYSKSTFSKLTGSSLG